MKKLTKKWYSIIMIAVIGLMLISNQLVQAAAPETGTETANQEKPLAGQHLTMAVNATFPPFESVEINEDSGESKIVGMDIDIANALADKLGFTFDINDMEFNGLVGALQSGRADFVLSGISPTEERKKSVDFSNDYFYPKTSIMCKKGADIKSLSDLSGKTVSASFGTTYEALAKGVEGVTVTSLNSTPLVIQELVNERVDAAIIDASQAVEFLKVQPTLEYHVLSDEEVPPDDSYAIACPKGSELVGHFNTALAEMQSSGELDEIITKWMGDDFNKKESAPAGDKPLAGQHLTMAVNATFPPFESVEIDEATGDSKIVGMDIDIANALADKLGFTFDINDMEFNGLVGALQSGRADFVLSGISPTDERKKSVDFSNDYFYPKTSIMCLKGADIKSLTDLSGKTVSASFGTTYEALAKGVEGVTVTSLNSTPLVIQELVNERVDAAIIDASQAVEFLKVQPTLEYHVLSEEEVPPDDSYAIACPKGSELVGHFNNALAEMQSSGELDTIVAKWMGDEFTKPAADATEKSTEAAVAEPETTGFKFDFGRILEYRNYFTDGIAVTLKFTGLSVLAGFLLGIILALIKVSNLKFLKLFARFYTSIFRGTPLLVQLFLVYFATPQLTGYKIPTLSAAVITFGLNSAAYISEILRGGIQSVDKGQQEAAMALGVPYRPMMFDIIIPQAVKTVLPGLVNETIALLKESSLVSTIGVVDMMRGGQMVMNSTYLAFEPFIIVALIYYVMVMILTSFANLLERRLNRSDKN